MFLGVCLKSYRLITSQICSELIVERLGFRFLGRFARFLVNADDEWKNVMFWSKKITTIE